MVREQVTSHRISLSDILSFSYDLTGIFHRWDKSNFLCRRILLLCLESLQKSLVQRTTDLYGRLNEIWVFGFKAEEALCLDISYFVSIIRASSGRIV